MSSYYYTNRIDNFEGDKEAKKTAFQSFLASISEGKNLIILFPVPIIAFVIAATIATHVNSKEEKRLRDNSILASMHMQPTAQQYAVVTNDIRFIAEDIKTESEPPPVFVKRTPILSSDVLEQRRQINLALLNKQSSGTNGPAGTKSKEEIIKDQQGQIKFISGMIAALRPTLENSGEVAKHIVELSHEKHVDPLFVAAIISVESMFKADAKSNVGAMGLMQLMPATAKEMAKKQSIKLNDPRTNIGLGIDYLVWLDKKYSGNKTHMLAAYNWGPGNMDKVLTGKSRTPAEVSKYASTIITRTNHWKRHYKTANTETDNIAAKL